MSRRALLIADADDPLTLRLTRHLRRPIVCPTPGAVGFSFTLDRQGRWEAGYFEVDGKLLGADELAGIVVRPGSGWSLPKRSRSPVQVWTMHEWRTALCAMLGAFPGQVVDRLPPGWFLDENRHREVLGHGLSVVLGSGAALGSRAEVAALLLGDSVLAADPRPGSEELAQWLLAQHVRVRAWQAAQGVRFGRVQARRHGIEWVLCGVERVARVEHTRPRALDAVAEAMCGWLSA